MITMLLQISSDTLTIATQPSQNSLNWLQILVSLLIGVIVTLTINLFVFPTIQSKVDEFLVDKFGSYKFRKKRKLTDYWDHQWFHQSKRYPNPCISQNVELKHYRNTVKAVYKITDIDGISRTYRMLGKVDGNHITGTWEDIESGTTYHGVFQLRILPNANELYGRWIGWSDSEIMQSNIWQWKRTSFKKYTKSNIV